PTPSGCTPTKLVSAGRGAARGSGSRESQLLAGNEVKPPDLGLAQGELFAARIERSELFGEKRAECLPGAARFPVVDGDEAGGVRAVAVQLGTNISGCAPEQCDPFPGRPISPLERRRRFRRYQEFPNVRIRHVGP